MNRDYRNGIYMLASLSALLPVLVNGQSVAEAGATAPSSGQATASSAASGSGELGEIVVTAQRRSEDIQKVPIAINAFTGASLSEAGVNNGADLSNIQPGLTISSFGPTANISLRGVQNEVFNAFGETDVAYNMDGVFQGRPTSPNASFFDVSRVELLKGPQGTLYGRNATAGAINIITNNPTDHFEAFAEAQGGDYNLSQVQGMVNIPLNDQLWFRAAFSTLHHSGYLSNNTDDADSSAGRVKVLWTPTEDFHLLVQGDYDHEGGNGSATVPSNPDGSYLSSNAYFRPYLLPNANSPGSPIVQVTGPQFQNNTNWGVQSQADLDLHWATLTVIPAFRKTDAYYDDWNGGFYELQNNRDNQSTIEARLASEPGASDALKWVTGLYFFDEDQLHNDVVEIAYPGQVFPGSPALLGGQEVPNLLSHSYAAFAQATYPIVPSIRLTLGARETYDKKSTDGISYTTFASPGTLAPAPGPYLVSSPLPYKLSTSSFNYKVGIDADVGPNSFIYANVGTGYKAGGFFGVPTTPIPGIFQPEHIMAYSIGSKNQFFDRRLQLNFEGFYWKYTDYQFANIFTDGAAGVEYGVFNLPKATIDGVDLDVAYLVTANDKLTASLEFLHTTTGIATLPSIVGILNISDESLPNAPDFAATLGYRHVWDIANGANITGLINTSIQTQQRIGLGPTTGGLLQSSYTRSSANLDYNAAEGKWYVGLWVRNLENSTVRNFGTIGTTQYVWDNLYPPRTFGAKIGARF